MFKDTIPAERDIKQVKNKNSLSKTEKLTSLWALSESTLGGILHAVRLPFRGIIISSAAIILICMIAEFSNRKGKILKSTFIVTIIKAVVSPHTPLTAYFSVLMQGVLGEIFFISRRIKFISTMLFAVSVSTLNGLQKIIVLTIIYGETLWQTLNDFLNYISDEWLLISLQNPVDFSFIIIASYAGVHIIAGVITGVIAFRIPKMVNEKINDGTEFQIVEIPEYSKLFHKTRRKKAFRIPAILVTLLSLSIIIISYFYPETDRFDIKAILLMIARSVLIITIWFYLLAPFIKKKFQIYFAKNKNPYSGDVELVLNNIQRIKVIVYSVWKFSAKFEGIKRIKYFVITSLAYLLKD